MEVPLAQEEVSMEIMRQWDPQVLVVKDPLVQMDSLHLMATMEHQPWIMMLAEPGLNLEDLPHITEMLDKH